MCKKVLSILLVTALLLSGIFALPLSITAAEVNSEEVGTNKTQSEAVQWITDRKNEGWAYDYDGTGGYAQCVDLIVYYFDYLEGWHLSGNGYDYVGRNDLPNGWYYTSSPSAGDIAVWGANVGIARGWGHVALVESVNGNNFNYVDVNGATGKGGSGTLNISNPSSFIHPNFASPTPDNLRVGVSGSEVYMNWDWDGNADYYDVKLWREKIWEGDPYRIVWSVKSNNYAFALPKGTYQAYVDAGNYNTGYYKMSNVVTFSIGDVGINLSAGIYGNQIYLNWNSDNSQTYNLKVYKEFTWDGELYENIWNIKETSYALALPKGRYQAYIDGKSMSNVIDFTVTDENPKLKVNVVGNQVYFNWNSDNNAKKYHLKIYKGHAWQIDAYEIINNITTTKEAVALPAGTYQAYLDAEGDDYWHMGNVIEFTVTDENPILKANVVGNQVYFNWNPDNKAQKYHLKIYKGHAWQIDAYEIINNITTTKEAVALPAGTYQAYLDAEGDDYWHMGNLIEFTVGNSEPVLTAKVKGNQVDFSWTKNSKAKLYHLKIWEGHAWMSAPYLVKWNLVGTKETVMLPQGSYQAYIDAVEDDNTVMGNVIDIVVETDNYHLPVIGDTNLDGNINVNDVTALQRHLADLTTLTDSELTAADANGDGVVDINDATHLQKYLAEYNVALGKQS